MTRYDGARQAGGLVSLQGPTQRSNRVDDELTRQFYEQPSTSLRRPCVPAISRWCRRRHLHIAKRRKRRTSSSVHRKRFLLQSFAFKPPAQGYPSIRSRQPSDSKFDLTIGELAPIFDNGRIATGRTFVDELAGLNPSLLQRQSEIFTCQVVISAFAQVASAETRKN